MNDTTNPDTAAFPRESWFVRFDKSRIATLLIFASVAVGFGLMNFLSPEWFYDDFPFSFVQAYRDTAGDKIDSFSKFITAVREHRIFNNGRLSDGFFTKSMLVGPNWIFDICNTLVLLIAVFFTAKIVRKGNENYGNNTILVALFVLWFWCVPSFYETALWVAGSANYLWSWAAIAVFIYLWQKNADEKFSWLKSSFLFAFSVFAGAMQEAFSLPMLCAFAFYYSFNFKQLKASSVAMIAGFFLGLLWIATAPAQQNRFDSTPLTLGLGVFRLGFSFVRDPETMILVVANLIGFSVLFFIDRDKFKNVFKAESFWLGSMLAGYCGLGLLVSGGRGFMGVWLFSVVLFLKLLCIFKISPKVLTILSLAGFVLMLAKISCVVPVQAALLNQHNEIKRLSENPRHSFIPVKNFDVFRSPKRYVLWTPSYFYVGMVGEIGFRHNLWGRYFGHPEMDLFPVEKSVCEAIETGKFFAPENAFPGGAYTTNNAYFFLIPESDGAFPSVEEIKNQWKFRCVPDTEKMSLPQKIRFFCFKKIGRLNDSEVFENVSDPAFVSVGGNTYLLLLKPFEMKEVPLRVLELRKNKPLSVPEK